jgi:PAS domain S-box-containing protein
LRSSSSDDAAAARTLGGPYDAPRGSHVVQLYEGDAFLLDQVSRFITSGFDAGDGLVLIATREHLDELRARLTASGVDLAAATADGSYRALDAAETLAAISVAGSPDRARFREIVGGTVERVAARRSHVRAFGEMVALLWAEGRHREALLLERLWNELARELPFSLLCAYPIAAYGSDPSGTALLGVCREHSRVVPAESYAALAAIVESSDDAIIGKTLDGTVTSWNEGARRLFGYTAEEMIGQPIQRLMPPDRIDDVRRILDKIRAGERVEHFETERVCKDGRRIHVSLSISPIKDASGNVIGASKIARDITQRKHDEEELRQHRRALELISQVGLALSAELELEKLLQSVTEAATRFTGAQYGAFFQKQGDHGDEHFTLHTLCRAPREAFASLGVPRSTPLFAPTFTGLTVIRLDDVTADPRHGRNEPHRGMPPGHVPVRSYMAVPIVGRGRTVLGALLLGHPRPGVFTEQAERLVTGLAAHAAVAIDNARLYETERRLRSEAETANRAKDEFLAMLGHELRNPLSSVRNAIVSASLDPSRRDRALGIARRGADQLARLVDDLLDVARISRGKIPLRRGRVRVATLVERAVEMTRLLVEERAHALTMSLPDGALEVDGDQTRLEQVLVNLITNAAKYTERGGHIDVRAEEIDGEAVVRVQDDGCGIPAEMLPRVFDLFSQGERGLERAQGGLGIGLTVVRRLVELHGGRVDAYSEGPGKGAEFVVRLPALPPLPVAAAPGSPGPESVEQRARVLLVEDNPDVAESMALLLELLGHQVTVVHDGLGALDVASTIRPDVILIDIGLPGIDGYEVARRLRQDATMHPMLVALTGYGRREDKERALEAGFDHHLTKPVEFDALSSLVETLPRRRAGRPPSVVH